MVPEGFSDLIGQPTAVTLLCRALDQGRLAPAYLFAGPEGVGRRRAALRLAESLLSRQPGPDPVHQRRIGQGNHPDLLWVEPTYLHQGRLVPVSAGADQGVSRKTPPQVRLEQVRQIAQFLSRPALEADRSMVVMEAAETMTEAAANGLLKTLEEPGRATLVLLAPGPQALLATLVSRCQVIPFQRLNAEDMARVLSQAGQPDILHHPQVMALAQGSPGQAIAAYTQLQAMSAELIAGLHQPPASLRQALELGRQIAKALDPEAQLWLLDYLLHWYWHTYPQQPQLTSWLAGFEAAKGYLRRFVTPRLVWEVTLMAMVPCHP
ncbi:MAG: DNA polymerase III subunit delta' [Cyanobacteria bacterium REEB459]|nr:DNA polymerase III subunit delta' [Cyanobacteria bacterium REEB459]